MPSDHGSEVARRLQEFSDNPSSATVCVWFLCECGIKTLERVPFGDDQPEATTCRSCGEFVAMRYEPGCNEIG